MVEHMRIAFVTTYNARDVRYWSGIPFYMSRALEEAGIEVNYVGPLRKSISPLVLTRWVYHKYVTRQQYDTEREPSISKSYAKQVERELSSLQPDVILCPGTIPVCQLRTRIPIVIWTDATFDGMIDYYPEWTNLTQTTLRNGHMLEQKALSHCASAVYASDWACETAMKHYKIDRAKLRVIPFGANLECKRTLEDAERLVQARAQTCCRLLFIGQQWHRKGGDLAVAVAAELNRRGVNTELVVVGCIPPDPMPEFVRVKGFIPKSTPAGKAALDQIFASSHFCLVPSRAECFGVAIGEAASFAVPSVTSGSGGTTTAVLDDQNGKNFTLDDFVSKATDFIQNQFSDWRTYNSLARSSFQVYERRLNWKVAASELRELLHELLFKEK